VTRSPRTSWYQGPTLLEHLEAVPVGNDPERQPFRFPVQVVIRPQDAEHHDYRGYAGRVEAGTVSVGDEVVVTPSGQRSTVVAIDTFDGPLAWAQASQSVTLRLADDIDISRGDMLAAAHAAPPVVRDVGATVTVVAEQALVPRQRLLLKAGSRTVRALVESIDSRLDVDTLEAHAGVERLALNDIGEVRIRLAEPVALDPYDEIRSTGAFLLIDDQTGATVAAGMVRTTAA
jgi:sulfate adenylyltransferase subunit 1